VNLGEVGSVRWYGSREQLVNPLEWPSAIKEVMLPPERRALGGDGRGGIPVWMFLLSQFGNIDLLAGYAHVDKLRQ
jgi:hypothetical protein